MGFPRDTRRVPVINEVAECICIRFHYTRVSSMHRATIPSENVVEREMSVDNEAYEKKAENIEEISFFPRSCMCIYIYIYIQTPLWWNYFLPIDTAIDIKLKGFDYWLRLISKDARNHFTNRVVYLVVEACARDLVVTSNSNARLIVFFACNRAHRFMETSFRTRNLIGRLFEKYF